MVTGIFSIIYCGLGTQRAVEGTGCALNSTSLVSLTPIRAGADICGFSIQKWASTIS